MVPIPRIELGSKPYHGFVLPLYYIGKNGGQSWIRTTEPEGRDLQSPAFGLFANYPFNGAETGIRTQGTLTRTPVFKTGALNQLDHLSIISSATFFYVIVGNIQRIVRLLPTSKNFFEQAPAERLELSTACFKA